MYVFGCFNAIKLRFFHLQDSIGTCNQCMQSSLANALMIYHRHKLAWTLEKLAQQFPATRKPIEQILSKLIPLVQCLACTIPYLIIARPIFCEKAYKDTSSTQPSSKGVLYWSTAFNVQQNALLHPFECIRTTSINCTVMGGRFFWCGEVCISLRHLIKYSCSCKIIASRCLTSGLIMQLVRHLCWFCFRVYVDRWLLRILKEWPNSRLFWEVQSELRSLLLAFSHLLHRCCGPHGRCGCLRRQRCRKSSPLLFC